MTDIMKQMTSIIRTQLINQTDTSTKLIDDCLKIKFEVVIGDRTIELVYYVIKTDVYTLYLEGKNPDIGAKFEEISKESQKSSPEQMMKIVYEILPYMVYIFIVELLTGKQ